MAVLDASPFGGDIGEAPGVPDLLADGLRFGGWSGEVPWSCPGPVTEVFGAPGFAAVQFGMSGWRLMPRAFGLVVVTRGLWLSL